MNADKQAEKLRKKLLREEEKRKQPKECQKYVRIIIDTQLAESTLGQELLAHLDTTQELKYKVSLLLEKNCLLWERVAGQQTFLTSKSTKTATTTTTELSEKWSTENQLLRLITPEELKVYKQQPTEWANVVQRLRAAYSEQQLSFLLPCLAGKPSSGAQFEREALITELQLQYNCNVLQIPMDAAELLQLLRRFHKAIAQAPYKQQKADLQQNFKKFVINDNKDCVRVEGSHGLPRLWQQHLNRLPLITLQVAESLRQQYSCPKHLLDHMEREPENIVNVLSDITVNRGTTDAAGSRRIGNVMAQKLIKLYKTRNPMETL